MEATAVRLGAICRRGTSSSNRIAGIEVGTPIPQLAEAQAITGLIDADLGEDPRNLRL
jgi:hypothetical protein